MRSDTRAIALLVVAELFGTSLWFSANAAAAALMQQWSLSAADIGKLTNAVQLGFITGTLSISLTGFADRHSASRVVAGCALLGAGSNVMFALLAENLSTALACRFVTGLALAGVYPLGMKLVVSFRPDRAGQTLAWLVGMLTLGTAFPHAVAAWGGAASWSLPLLVSALLATAAAGIVAYVGDGPHLPAAQPGAPAVRAVVTAFRVRRFRGAAFGYFGHMWELYAFWTLVPFLLGKVLPKAPASVLSGLTFLVVAVGALGCIGGGALTRRVPGQWVAAAALLSSGACCLSFPWIAGFAPPVTLALLLVWGVCVVADSPQFSALSAAACPSDAVGAALAIQNGIGFSISVVSIALTTELLPTLSVYVTLLLLPGPLLGLLAMRSQLRRAPVPRQNHAAATPPTR